MKTGVGMAKLPLTKELWGVRFARIALDIISGFIRTPSGNTCMLVVQDYYTKYTRVFPLPDQKALTCAEALVNGWILLFGCPFVCHSDQGRNFESDLWKEMCSLLEIHKTRTNPYRPESDGAVERFNRTLIASLTTMVNQDQSNWDVCCNYVAHAYNASIHASTGLTPNMLLFGDEVVMPADLQLGSMIVGTYPVCYQTFAQSIRENLHVGYSIASRMLESTAEVQKVAFDRGAKTRQFMVGDKVLRYHSPLARLKLGTNWDGPYVVRNVISDHTIVLCNDSGKLFKSSVARLKLFRSVFELRDETTFSGGSDSDSDSLLVTHDALDDKFRGSTKPRRVRRKLNKKKHVPEFSEPFHGAKSIDLRRSERIRLLNTK